MPYKFTNRLINETSPYLLQHAHNPVDWYPWCDEAFTLASEGDRPVLLSVGYSACHWCHVMEKESFENEETAAIMNSLYINIKVDREERPDIDELYQYALQLFGRGGGWPLTIFLTPDGKPFFGGTYFPPGGRSGISGFPEVLHTVAEAFRGKKKEIDATTAEIKSTLEMIHHKKAAGGEMNLAERDGAVSRMLRDYDPVHGGFGSAPKFPGTPQLALLLRYYKKSGESFALKAAGDTLRNMAEGGIYDQLGGGFHRYSVDERWLIPHFEKMLYDNALLARVYLEAFRVTKDTFYRNIAEETLNYLIREMYHPQGGFYTSQDADSEGVEGKYFIWSPEEIRSILGKDAEIVCRFYGITEEGNLDGANVLHVDRGLEALSHEFELPEDNIRNILASGREKLLARREERVRPFRDTKIITGWNSLAISAFIDAYNTTGTRSYLDTARVSFDFIKSHLYRDGSLLHVWSDGVAKWGGNLDDYAFSMAAAMDMFEATFDDEYLQWADRLAGYLIEHFLDREMHGFYNTADDLDALFHRLKTGSDQSLPSGNAVASIGLLRLSYYRDNEEYREIAERSVHLFYDDATERPFIYATILSAVPLFIEGAREITLMGNRASDDLSRLLRKLGETYVPDKVIYLIDEVEKGHNLPMFARGKSQKEGKATAYICRNFTCSRPLTEWKEIEKLL